MIDTSTHLFERCGPCGTARYRLGARLGEGEYGRVFSATLMSSPSASVAIKFIRLDGMDDVFYQNEERAFAELRLHCRNGGVSRTFSRHVVAWHESFTLEVKEAVSGRRELYGATVLDFISTITLDDYLAALNANGQCLPSSLVLSYALQVARGVTALHDAGVAHLDIKSANIAFDEARQHLTLFDLGFAVTFRREPAYLQKARVTCSRMSPLYAAPEQLNLRANPKTSFNPFKADIWALGHVFFELMDSVSLFPHDTSLKNHMAFVARYDCVKRAVPRHVAAVPLYAKMIDMTLRYLPDLRASASTISATLDQELADLLEQRQKQQKEEEGEGMEVETEADM